jgi:hypothetical protein
MRANWIGIRPAPTVRTAAKGAVECLDDFSASPSPTCSCAARAVTCGSACSGSSARVACRAAYGSAGRARIASAADCCAASSTNVPCCATDGCRGSTRSASCGTCGSTACARAACCAAYGSAGSARIASGGTYGSTGNTGVACCAASTGSTACVSCGIAGGLRSAAPGAGRAATATRRRSIGATLAPGARVAVAAPAPHTTSNETTEEK